MTTAGRQRTAIVVAAGIVLVVAGLTVFGALVYSDEKGAPVPFTYRGAACWRAGDLLTCPRAGPNDVFIASGERWLRPRECSPVSPTVVRCRRPYPLEIDTGGDYARLRRARR
jgi:hypothetical protein